MEVKKLFITGPRLQFLGGFDEYNSKNTEYKTQVYNNLYDNIEAFGRDSQFEIYVGVEQGVEQWAVSSLLMMKEMFNIKIHLLLPYRNIGNVWPAKCQEQLSKLKEQVDSITVVDEIPQYETKTARENEFSKVKVLNLLKYGIGQADTVLLFNTADCTETRHCKNIANECSTAVTEIML